MVISKTKKYKGVYKDSKGKIYFQIELGVDPILGKEFKRKEGKINRDYRLILLRKLMKRYFV